MRFVSGLIPDKLAQLGVTAPEVIAAIQTQNNVNPAGQIGAEPIPKGQQFTYTVRTQGRLVKPEEFGNIILRANADGSILHLSDVARIELGDQAYAISGRYNQNPSGVMAVYQLPGSNAVATAAAVNARMKELSATFPSGISYNVPLDTTKAVSSGIHEIVITLLEALALVVIVVFIFLQGWRATLIPLLAVPVSLIGTFIIFPALGFSINTLSLFGLVLAIGLVVDDAIIVVEAVEHHIDEGMDPKAATIKAMEEVGGPVVAIALILAAVFIPTAFIPGITGRLYQQFAVTIAISVLISAFNALTLSPALASLLLKPRTKSRSQACSTEALHSSTSSSVAQRRASSTPRTSDSQIVSCDGGTCDHRSPWYLSLALPSQVASCQRKIKGICFLRCSFPTEPPLSELMLRSRRSRRRS